MFMEGAGSGEVVMYGGRTIPRLKGFFVAELLCAF